MSMLRALIFDIDGTVAETEQDGHRVAFNQAFAEAGLDWHWSVDLYGKLLSVSGGKERIKFYVEHYCPGFKSKPPFQGDLDDLIAHLHATKTKYFKQILQEGKVLPRPGIRRLIREAQEQGVKLAIATTSSPQNAIALLRSVLSSDSPDWFEVIAAGDIVPQKKPAPDIYYYILEHLRLSPEQCLVFEDSRHGLLSATHARLKTVITVSHYTQHLDFEGASLVLDHLGEPDHPFRVIVGDVGHHQYFDLELAHEIVCS